MGNQLDFFHNTIGLLPSEKVERERKALSQTEHILQIFKAYPDKDFTPPEICEHLPGFPLLTSVRRSISDLTKAGDLVKTENKRMGKFNEMNYTWKLRSGSTLK